MRAETPEDGIEAKEAGGAPVILAVTIIAAIGVGTATVQETGAATAIAQGTDAVTVIGPETGAGMETAPVTVVAMIATGTAAIPIAAGTIVATITAAIAADTITVATADDMMIGGIAGGITIDVIADDMTTAAIAGDTPTPVDIATMADAAIGGMGPVARTDIIQTGITALSTIPVTTRLAGLSWVSATTCSLAAISAIAMLSRSPGGAVATRKSHCFAMTRTGIRISKRAAGAAIATIRVLTF
ncbi:MAG: hypothetical protein AAGD92_07845 [Pseudomonadota bacterium]